MPWVHMLCADGWMPSTNRAADMADRRLAAVWVIGDEFTEALAGAVNQIDGADPARRIVAGQVGLRFAPLGPTINVDSDIVAFVNPGPGDTITPAAQRTRRVRFHDILHPKLVALYAELHDCEWPPELLIEIVLEGMTGSTTSAAGVITDAWGGARKPYDLDEAQVGGAM